ncbi:MAG: adenosine deaminase family protein [Armatimonadetes bacterium]|nr:adenosine deaminase family protein [Armatimonadota bacterium]
MADLRERLARVPKAELHLHLRGAVPPALIGELIRRHGVAQAAERAHPRLRELWERSANLGPLLAGDLGDEALSRLFAYDDFDNFLGTFAFTGYFFRTVDDFAALVDGVLACLAAQHIVYAEITVSLREYLNQGLPLDGLLECLARAADLPGAGRRGGAQPGAAPPVRVQWIVDLVRNFGVDKAQDLLDQLPAPANPFVGLTIGGSEHRFPPELFTEVYARAASSGLRRSVHAGEALGPESVWTSLRELGAERIGHGVRAIEDPELVAYLAEHRVPLEICPTSNLRTGVYATYADHPLRRLMEAGVTASLSTDDPTFFHTTLVDEFLRAHAMGIDEAGLLALLENGFRHAFLPAGEREGYVRSLRAVWASGGGYTL